MSLTAQQICVLAGQISKGPGFQSQAGQFLNLVLEDLFLVRDLKINRVTQTITLPANSFGPFNLEADYERTYDLFYPMPSAGQPANAPGVTIFLDQATTKFMDAQFKDISTANYPYMYSTDLSPQATGGVGLLYVYPASSGIILLTHRYMLKRPDIATPESSSSIPWFPHTDYLVTATAARLMAITGDDRKPQFDADAERMLAPYLIQQGDEQQTTHSIELDPFRFRSSRALRLTKSSPI